MVTWNENGGEVRRFVFVVAVADLHKKNLQRSRLRYVTKLLKSVTLSTLERLRFHGYFAITVIAP